MTNYQPSECELFLLEIFKDMVIGKHRLPKENSFVTEGDSFENNPDPKPEPAPNEIFQNPLNHTKPEGVSNHPYS